MKSLAIIVAASLVAGSAFAQDQATRVEKSVGENKTTVVLLGRACRASDDSTWLDICSAALQQAMKELDAMKKSDPQVTEIHTKAGDI